MAGNQNQLGRSIATSIGNFFGGGSSQARQAGELAGLQQVALEDQIMQRRDAAAAAKAKAAAEATQAALAGPGGARQRAMQLFGVPLDQEGAVEAWQRTGSLPESAMTPAINLPDGLQGPTAPAAAPSWASNLSQLAQYFAADQAVQAGSAKGMDDFFKGLNLLPQANLTAGIANGSMDPAVGGRRAAAIDGKPLVSGHEWGVVDNFGGRVDTNNPAAVRYGKLTDAKTEAQIANAAQSRASANASNASAAKSRQETAAGMKTGQIQVVTDGAGNITLVDKFSGQGRPVIGPDGKPLAPKLPGGKPSDAAQKIADANDVLSLLDLAEGTGGQKGLIDKSTSGYLGQVVDEGYRLFGASNEGAQAAAQLRALEGALVSKMPKMSGPQSDKDVLLYRQMAGQIGDPSIPAATKKAAIKTIRDINERHAGPNSKPGSNPVVTLGANPDAEFAALPSGARFRGPDGKIRVKP